MNEVIFTSRSSNYFLISLLEFFSFVVKDSIAILEGLSINNIVDSGLNVLRRINVNIDVSVLKILIAVVDDSIRKALRSK